MLDVGLRRHSAGDCDLLLSLTSLLYSTHTHTDWQVLEQRCKWVDRQNRTNKGHIIQKTSIPPIHRLACFNSTIKRDLNYPLGAKSVTNLFLPLLSSSSFLGGEGHFDLKRMNEKVF